MAVLFIALVCIAALTAIEGKDLQKCERDYSKIGCYEEGYPDKADLLLNERSNIQWTNIEKFMHHLACKCDDEARAKNKGRKESEKYAGFALHYWGECYGKTRAQLNALMAKGESHRCTGSQKYDGCRKEHKECVGHEFAEVLYEFKAAAPKDIDGGYSDWENWTPCKGKCGMGLKVRERTCTNPKPQGKGKDCSGLGDSTEGASCDTGKKCPVNGGYGKWSKYAACSKSCGGGIQTRTRKCDSPAPQHGGLPCTDPASESQACNTEKCPVNGGLSPWSSYGPCSKSCGGGTKKKTRACTNPAPEFGGSDCIGALSKSASCNTNRCPVNGGYSGWSGYGSCSKSCGGGLQTRSRSCNNPSPAYGGKNCPGQSTQMRSCNTHVCLSGEYTKRACENGNCYLSCPGSSRITITHALYGRKTKSICKGFDWTWSTNCGAGSSWSKVHGACENTSSCRVYANNNVFGDPCRGTPKYLEIKYRCKG
eukprot:Seg4965.1 transcript_id=Seg4965.1/GoldUCD/mRNA.D3Y31 product=Hemicentin-1 protein_id=Seg4965.1/GoldUCD/D3Y31